MALLRRATAGCLGSASAAGDGQHQRELRSPSARWLQAAARRRGLGDAGARLPFPVEQPSSAPRPLAGLPPPPASAAPGPHLQRRVSRRRQAAEGRLEQRAFCDGHGRRGAATWRVGPFHRAAADVALLQLRVQLCMQTGGAGARRRCRCRCRAVCRGGAGGAAAAVAAINSVGRCGRGLPLAAAAAADLGRLPVILAGPGPTGCATLGQRRAILLRKGRGQGIYFAQPALHGKTRLPRASSGVPAAAQAAPPGRRPGGQAWDRHSAAALPPPAGAHLQVALHVAKGKPCDPHFLQHGTRLGGIRATCGQGHGHTATRWGGGGQARGGVPVNMMGRELAGTCRHKLQLHRRCLVPSVATVSLNSAWSSGVQHSRFLLPLATYVSCTELWLKAAHSCIATAAIVASCDELAGLSQTTLSTIS